MKKLNLSLIIYFLLLSSFSWAQINAIETQSIETVSRTSTQSIEKMGVETQVSVSPWYNEQNNKDAEFNLKSRIRLDGWINVTKDGCLKIKGRVSTGNRFNNEWFNTGQGTQAADFSIALRQLYINSKCRDKIELEAGVVPIRTHGSLGLASAGNMNGLNVIYQDEEHKRNWIFSVGEIESEVDLFKRKYEDINLVAVQVRQEFKNNMSSFGSIALKDQQLLTRAGLAWALKKYHYWLKEMNIETLVRDDHVLGFMSAISFENKLSQKNKTPWKSRLAFSYIDPKPSDEERFAFLFKQFYGYGANLLIENSKELSKRVDFNLRLRFGDAGTLAQTGIQIKLSSRKDRTNTNQQ